VSSLYIFKPSSNYVVAFDHFINCSHLKHLSRFQGYTFVFCKKTKRPLSIICPDSIKGEKDVEDLLLSLADVFFKSHKDPIQSPYFQELSASILSTKNVIYLSGDSKGQTLV
jgi:hypothetical protein